MKLVNSLRERWDKARYINKLTIIFIIGFIIIYKLCQFLMKKNTKKIDPDNLFLNHSK